ncbi:Membrane protein involved in the export of O-antigen and teichoic acid [Haladaptatus litoreus]|uniref:Membrane protein involved in the export of O-antigen and teichoic acid n=1 Tax=Haladaptatus litoreus TaxID=553468 RepID=A0A1N7DL11_9EURY|nr:flippase [Haladaptatus litoreus]SIR76514.1 Membrane protein involved in the export of O-antigen and teichoic acid [Haladaptatus litoreus]
MGDIEKEISSLVSSAAMVFIGAAIGAGTTLIERIIIGRNVTPSTYGDISVGLAIISFASILSLLGMKQGLPRQISRQESKQRIADISSFGTMIVLLSSVSTVAILFITRPFFLSRLFDGEIPNYIQYFLFTIPFIVMLEIGVSIARGLEITWYRALLRDIVYPVLRISLIVLLILFGFTKQSVSISYLISAMILAVVIYSTLISKFRHHIRVPKFETNVLLFSLPLVISSAASILLTKSDTLLIGFYLPSAYVGYYEAAYPIANGLIIILSSFGFLYLPMISRLDANDQISEIQRIYQLVTKWVFIATFPLFATIIIFSEEILSLIFGSEYSSGSIVLIILAVGFFTNAAAGRNRETITALGFPQVELYLNLFAFTLNIVLNVILIPIFGIIGAAGSSALSFLFVNAASTMFLYNKYDIIPVSKNGIKIMIILPLMIIPVSVLVFKSFSIDIIGIAIYTIVCYAITLLIAIILGGISPLEEDIILEIQSKISQTN